jgi:hypothetical protein
MEWDRRKKYSADAAGWTMDMAGDFRSRRVLQGMQLLDAPTAIARLPVKLASWNSLKLKPLRSSAAKQGANENDGS